MYSPQKPWHTGLPYWKV